MTSDETTKKSLIIRVEDMILDLYESGEYDIDEVADFVRELKPMSRFVIFCDVSERGYVELFEQLYKDFDEKWIVKFKKFWDCYGNPMLEAAACNEKVLAYMIDKYKFNVKDENELIWAVDNNLIKVVENLLKCGATSEINKIDAFGQTPLHIASRYEFIDIAKLLLEYGADVNVKENKGRTPLHWASEKGYTGIVKLLLEHGADVNAQDVECWAPLHWASEEGNTGMVKLLLEYGADINAKNNKGNTPLYCASWEGCANTVKLLLEYNEMNK